MTPNPDKPGHFKVQRGETITVVIRDQQNTKDLVNYTWNNTGQPSQPINNPFVRQITDPLHVLGVGVFFDDLSGGSFNVELRGDMGGVPYLDPCRSGGDYTNEVYWFEV